MWDCVGSLPNVRAHPYHLIDSPPFTLPRTHDQFFSLVPRGGMVAPILGGSLLMVNNSFPVYASIVIFLVATVCVLLLKEDEGDRGGAKGSFVH